MKRLLHTQIAEYHLFNTQTVAYAGNKSLGVSSKILANVSNAYKKV